MTSRRHNVHSVKSSVSAKTVHCRSGSECSSKITTRIWGHDQSTTSEQGAVVRQGGGKAQQIALAVVPNVAPLNLVVKFSVSPEELFIKVADGMRPRDVDTSMPKIAS